MAVVSITKENKMRRKGLVWKTWEVPAAGYEGKKPQRRGFNSSGGRVSIVKIEIVALPLRIPTENILLQVRVMFNGRVPHEFEHKARKLAYRWFLYEKQAEINTVLKEQQKVGIGIGYVRSDTNTIVCSIFPA